MKFLTLIGGRNTFKEVPPPDILNYYSTTATDTPTNTTTTFVADGLTLTPIAGTYLAFFNTESSHDISGITNVGEIGLFVGGTVVTGSERRFGIRASGISLASLETEHTPTIIIPITVNGSQAVESKFRRVTGSDVSLGKRSLVLLRIS